MKTHFKSSGGEKKSLCGKTKVELSTRWPDVDCVNCIKIRHLEPVRPPTRSNTWSKRVENKKDEEE